MLAGRATHKRARKPTVQPAVSFARSIARSGCTMDDSCDMMPLSPRRCGLGAKASFLLRELGAVTDVTITLAVQKCTHSVYVAIHLRTMYDDSMTSNIQDARGPAGVPPALTIMSIIDCPANYVHCTHCSAQTRP